MTTGLFPAPSVHGPRPGYMPKNRVMFGATWTPALEASLREMWSAGATVAVIADALGVSRGAVTGKTRRLQLEMRGNPVTAGPPPEVFERFVDLVAEGASIEMAARSVGMALTTAKGRWRALCRRMGPQAA